MLIGFTFKNFKSFAEETVFTMQARADGSHPENLVGGGYRLSKAKVIYGANASGKTSFVEAINFVRQFLLNSNRMMANQKIPITPYKFRDNALREPSSFSLAFIKDGKKYIYEFSCTRDKVLTEKLCAYYSAKPTTIFSRKSVNEYYFCEEDARLLNDIKSKNTDNKLFLATAETWNYDKVKPVVDFILNDIFVASNLSSVWSELFAEIEESGEMGDFKNFCLEFLNNADFSIDGFDFEAKKNSEANGEAFTSAVAGYPEKEELAPTEGKKSVEFYNIRFNHRIKREDGELTYSLDSREESLGTINMFQFAPLLYNVIKKGGVLIVDEIDRSLHPLLVKYLFGLFLDGSVNVNDAQLIANTHDTNMLDLDFFRRDEIWFTERDYETGETTMFSLADFSPRKTENVEKAYLLGRYGAIPFIQGV